MGAKLKGQGSSTRHSWMSLGQHGGQFWARPGHLLWRIHLRTSGSLGCFQSLAKRLWCWDLEVSKWISWLCFNQVGPRVSLKEMSSSVPQFASRLSRCVQSDECGGTLQLSGCVPLQPCSPPRLLGRDFCRWNFSECEDRFSKRFPCR